jgi:hypothetical protein
MGGLRGSATAFALIAVTALFSACSGSDSASGAAVDVGGTVVSYADRDYSGAAWEQVWDTDALLSRAGAEAGLRLRGLQHITGIDHDNLWVADRYGLLFGVRDGHWRYHGSVTDGAAVTALHAVTADTVAVGGDWRRGGPPLLLVTPEGIRRFDSDQRGTSIGSAHIAVLAEDFIDYYTTRYLKGTSFRLLSGELTPLRPDRERAALLHRDDNTPIADYPVNAIMHTATFEPGREAYAFWRNPSRRGQGATAEFRDGIWMLRDQIPLDLYGVRAAWFGRNDDGVFLIAVGNGGFVLRQILGGQALEQSLTGAPLTATSGDLIAVWGHGPDDYRVMDSNGQVWRRTDNEWRTVVRGLYDDDVVFNAAYVAPNGSIHAVTDGSLYRLAPL